MLPQIRIQITTQSRAAMKVKLEAAKTGLKRGVTAGVRAAGIGAASFIPKEFLSGQLVKIRSGVGRRAFFSRMDGPYRAVIGVGEEAYYLRYVNDGARPHIIAPKNKKALAFTPGAGRISMSAFATKAGIKKTLLENRIAVKFVHHPGFPGVHFMEVGLTAYTPEAVRIITAAAGKGLRGRE